MSIIHDALKKVQTKNFVASEIPPRATPQPNITPATPKASPEQLKYYLTNGMIAVFSIAVVLIFIFLFKLVSETRPLSTPVAQTLNQPKNQPVNNTIVPPAVPDKPGDNNELKIEGVMNISGKMVALINGTVYEEGQTVKDKTIHQITLDNITVNNTATGEEIILPVKH